MRTAKMVAVMVSFCVLGAVLLGQAAHTVPLATQSDMTAAKARLTLLEARVAALEKATGIKPSPAVARAPAGRLPQEFFEPLEVGQEVRVTTAKIAQVMSTQEAIIFLDVKYRGQDPQQPPPPASPGQSQQFESKYMGYGGEDPNAVHTKTMQFWLKGVDTKGWVDGREVRINKTLRISGSQTFATINKGRTTIFELEECKP